MFCQILDLERFHSLSPLLFGHFFPSYWQLFTSAISTQNENRARVENKFVNLDTSSICDHNIHSFALVLMHLFCIDDTSLQGPFMMQLNSEQALKQVLKFARFLIYRLAFILLHSFYCICILYMGDLCEFNWGLKGNVN